MKISRGEVEHVAQLARLQFTEEQLDMFVNQLNTILDYFDKLQDLDTADIEPTSHAIEIHTPFRNDAVNRFTETNLLIGNAPAEEHKCFKVPQVIE